jgi:hypothetical protein
MKWTINYLEDARRAQIDADISALIQDAVDIYEKTVWTRLFKLEEDSGKSKGLGATGISVPFADGGNGTVDYTPVPRPDRMINPFNTSHNHYLRLDGITQDNLETAVGHVWEHGFDAPFDLIVSQADLGSWQNTTNVKGFKPIASQLVQYGSNADLALLDSEIYQGLVTTAYGSCRLYANARIPTGYWSVTKSFGQNDARNSMKVRFDDFYGFGVKLVTESVSLYPFTGAIAKFRFGAGVGNSRTSAVLVENDSSGSYATPTIS